MVGNLVIRIGCNLAEIRSLSAVRRASARHCATGTGGLQRHGGTVLTHAGVSDIDHCSGGVFGHGLRKNIMPPLTLVCSDELYVIVFCGLLRENAVQGCRIPRLCGAGKDLADSQASSWGWSNQSLEMSLFGAQHSVHFFCYVFPLLYFRRV